MELFRAFATVVGVIAFSFFLEPAFPPGSGGWLAISIACVAAVYSPKWWPQFRRLRGLARGALLIVGVALLVSLALVVPGHRMASQGKLHEASSALGPPGHLEKASAERQRFSFAQKRALISGLQAWATPHANVVISFATSREERLAQWLVSVFELAGWKVNFQNLPFEPQMYKSFPVTEVSGFVKNRVISVAAALRLAGFLHVEVSMRPNKILKTNPKWPWVEDRVYIMVGHLESEKPIDWNN